jgi:hypothetical protein
MTSTDTPIFPAHARPFSPPPRPANIKGSESCVVVVERQQLILPVVHQTSGLNVRFDFIK